MEETLPQVIERVEDLPTTTRDKIILMLLSGEFPSDADIARATGVRPFIITKLLASDPELVVRRKEAEREMAQAIEKSAFTLATQGRNEMAKQKSQEFLLRKLMPEKYGDNSEMTNGTATSKRVVINFNMPEVKTDQDGIPVIESKSPLEE